VSTSGRTPAVDRKSHDSDSAIQNGEPATLWYVTAGVLALAFVWSYWPILIDLIDQWNRIPDYSHGFLVIPLAAYFLWARRDSFPGIAGSISWAGLVLILVAGGLRVAGAMYYMEVLHGWSIPFWIAGFVWMFCGWQALKWSIPAIFFLFFMVPIPYSIETLLSQPLQRISTLISLFVLQCLGQSAVSEGTTIVIGTLNLEVERACSGLRIFFGIAALAYAFMILFRRPLWTRLILLLAILPITLLANSLRIVATALLLQAGMGETVNHLSHDLAGWVMIPVAAGFFALTLLYLDKLFPEVRAIDSSDLVRRQSQLQSSS
jgi:exosortase